MRGFAFNLIYFFSVSHQFRFYLSEKYFNIDFDGAISDPCLNYLFDWLAS